MSPLNLFKPKSVPFALKEKATEAIRRLESISVLEKVDFSDWATTIVPVLKPDGTVRICGDYKVTINPVLQVPEYPMLAAEELFAHLNGGEKFTELDSSSAYQQVLLDEESRQYVTINTHLALFRCTCLPFGVSGSPAIFQQTMDTILNGLKGVSDILDYLVVTGPDDATHLHNLEKIFHTLHAFSVKLKRSKYVLMKPSVEYFAFVVDKRGLHPSSRKVQAIQEIPVPQNNGTEIIPGVSKL